MVGGPGGADGRRGRTRRIGAKLVAGGFVVAGGVALAGSVLAASVPAQPAPGPTGCAALSRVFGGGSPWAEIRFSTLPGVGGSATGSAGGVTVTITRTSETTLSFSASEPIDLAWVNAGRQPNASSAAYHYVPPVAADGGLSGIGGTDPLDHALFCVALGPSTTTTDVTTTQPTTTTLATTTVATTSPPSTAPATTATVRSVPPVTPSAPQATSPTTPAPTTQATPATVAGLQLPRTGADAGVVGAIGATLVGLGVVLLAFTRRRRLAAVEDGVSSAREADPARARR